jgi:hypothetical protein
MHPDERLRRAVKGFYAWLGSLVLAGIGPLVAINLVESGSTAWRVVGVVVGVVAWVPIGLVVAFIIRDGDEFHRRIHLVTLSISFGGALVLISLFDWLVRAEFVSRPQLSVMWLLIAILWVVVLFAVKRFYERER